MCKKLEQIKVAVINLEKRMIQKAQITKASQEKNECEHKDPAKHSPETKL